MQTLCMCVCVRVHAPSDVCPVTRRERQNEDRPVFSACYKTAKRTADNISEERDKLHSGEQSKFQLRISTETLTMASGRVFYVGFAQREGVKRQFCPSTWCFSQESAKTHFDVPLFVHLHFTQPRFQQLGLCRSGGL